jgi:hypothetical protein
VKVGEETREDRLLNVIFKLRGDTSSLTGKDLMKVSVPNGVDLQNLETRVQQLKSAKTHKIKVKKLSSESRSEGGVQTRVDEVFEVQVSKMKK